MSDYTPTTEATRMCAVDGCAKAPIARGWCGAHWRRWRKFGDPLVGGEVRVFAPSDLTAWQRVARIGWDVVDGCWLSRAVQTSGGYAQVQIGRKTTMAHRASYEHHVGEIPAGMVVRHKCDIRHCVNPAHLETGTQAENEADKIARGRRPMGSATVQAKLTEPEVAVIKSLIMRGSSHVALGEAFGVSRATISKIGAGATWRDVAPIEAARLSSGGEG